MDFPRSAEQIQVLKRAVKNNGVVIKDIAKLYSTRENAYRGLWDLENKELLKKEESPPNSNGEYVWIPTNKGKMILDNKDKTDK